MVHRLCIFESDSYDPYRNLAVEQYLLEALKPGDVILYLWQNSNTVVIGRNQNAYRECRTSLLESEGGHLARRLSGGGAVYHDLGNLNFTFLMCEEDYDVRRQHEVIRRALRSLGIPAEISGRNDITVQGSKVSGNAFYRHDGRAYHHGTLLVNVDVEKMSRYLSPSRAKLKSRAVDSVRSRVANLRDFVPGLTCGRLAYRLEEAFARVYSYTGMMDEAGLSRDEAAGGIKKRGVHDGDMAVTRGCGGYQSSFQETQESPGSSDMLRSRVEILDEASFDDSRISALTMRNQSHGWLYGDRRPFTAELEARYSWGEIAVELEVRENKLFAVRVFTDAMDWNLPHRLEMALTGCEYDTSCMKERILAELGGVVTADYAGACLVGSVSPESGMKGASELEGNAGAGACGGAGTGGAVGAGACESTGAGRVGPGSESGVGACGGAGTGEGCIVEPSVLRDILDMLDGFGA